MACRRNILSLANEETNEIIRRHDLGVTVTGADPKEVAAALRALHVRVRERPVLPAPPDEYSEAHTVATYADILASTLKRWDRRGATGPP